MPTEAPPEEFHSTRALAGKVRRLVWTLPHCTFHTKYLLIYVFVSSQTCMSRILFPLHLQITRADIEWCCSIGPGNVPWLTNWASSSRKCFRILRYIAAGYALKRTKTTCTYCHEEFPVKVSWGDESKGIFNDNQWIYSTKWYRTDKDE